MDASPPIPSSTVGPPALLVSEWFPPKTGGSARWFWEIYRRLPAERVLMVGGQDPRQQEFDRASRVHVERLPLSFPSWGVARPTGLARYLKTAWQLRRLVRQRGAGALHCGKCLPEGLLGYMLRRGCGLPYLCYVHGEELNIAAGSRELGWLTRTALGGARLVIANSRNTERILKDAWGVPAEKLHVLHPGVDSRRFVPAQRDQTVRQRLGWGNRPVVLTVGRLQIRKGQDQMILGLPAIRRAVPDVLYAVVGDGPERARLEALVAQHGLKDHVLFMGEIGDEDLVRCYQQCDVFVLPNREVDGDFEGFGMVLVEAQACGRPVIAGASGGTAETMQIPDTGQVVCCDGPELLADLVANWLRDRERLECIGLKARAWAVEQFDWESLLTRAKIIFASMEKWPAARSGAAHPSTGLGARP